MEEASIIGIDLVKGSLQVYGARADGSVTYRRKLSRGRPLRFLASQPHCVVAAGHVQPSPCPGHHDLDERLRGRTADWPGRRTQRDGIRPVSTSTRGSGYARNCGSFVFHSLIRIRAHCTVTPSFTTNSSSPAGVQSSQAKLLERKESTSRL